MKFFIPKRGDTVRVRLASGEVVDAIYDEQAAVGPHHWVKIKGYLYQTTIPSKLRQWGSSCCTFVGPGAVMEARS